MPEDMILKVDLKAAENQPKHVQSYVNFFFKNSLIIFSELAPEEVNITECNKSSGMLNITVDNMYTEGVLNGTVEQSGVTVEITNLLVQKGHASIQIEELNDGAVNYSNLHFSPVIVCYDILDVTQSDEDGKHRFMFGYTGNLPVTFGHGQLSATAYYNGVNDENVETQIAQECDYNIISSNVIVNVILPNDHEYTKLSNITIVPDNDRVMSGSISPKTITVNENKYQPLIKLTSKESDESKIKMHSFEYGKDDNANITISSTDVLPISSSGHTVTFKKLVSDGGDSYLSVIVKDNVGSIVKSYETKILVDSDTVEISSISEYLYTDYGVYPVNMNDMYFHFNNEDEVVITLEGSSECNFVSKESDTKLLTMNSNLCIYKGVETNKYINPGDHGVDPNLITDAGVLNIDATITPIINGKVNKDSTITVSNGVRSVRFDTDNLEPEIDYQMKTSVFHNEETNSNHYYNVGICTLSGSSVDYIVNNIVNNREAILIMPDAYYISLGVEGSPSEESVYYLLGSEITESFTGYTASEPLYYTSTDQVEEMPRIPDSFTLFILEKGASLAGILYLSLCDTEEEADSQTVNDSTVLVLRKII